MTGEDFEQVGNAVAVRIFVGDHLETGRDIERLARFLQYLFRLFQTLAECVAGLVVVRPGIARHVAQPAVVHFGQQVRPHMQRERLLVDRLREPRRRTKQHHGEGKQQTNHPMISVIGLPKSISSRFRPGTSRLRASSPSWCNTVA